MSSASESAKPMPLLAIPAVAVAVIGSVLLAAWCTSKKTPDLPPQPPTELPLLLPPGQRPPLADLLVAVADDLRKVPPEKRLHQRYLSLANLGERKAGISLMLHRLAPRTTGNPFEPRGVGLRELDTSGDIIAVDLTEWFLTIPEWHRITKANPYAMRYDQAANEHVRIAATNVTQLSDSANVLVRADWFLYRLASMPAMRRPHTWIDGRRLPLPEWLVSYRTESLWPAHAAADCGMPASDLIQDVFRAYPGFIERFRLQPWLAGKPITRADWERLVAGVSAAQEFSRACGLGSPIPIVGDDNIE